MLSILDIFSGCGGLTLGAHQAGLQAALAVDVDPILSSCFGVNFPNIPLIQHDVRKLDTQTLRKLLPKGVDGVVGGPPCQAFSEMGRRDKLDPRRTLVVEYFRVVAALRPKFFLFENVRGLGFEEHRSILDEGLQLVPQYTIFGPALLNAADFGAPTRRFRLFVVGLDPSQMDVPDEAALFETAAPKVIVYDAINDLLGATASGEKDGFDLWRYDGRRAISAYAKKMRNRSGIFTGNRKTRHTAKTIKRFSNVRPGKNDKIGKYARLDWGGVCPTLRAGTGSDRGSYQAVRPVHPEEDRVITVREAARLQGFPDHFVFHPTIWHSFRMIGNSVSPILARVLFSRIIRQVNGSAPLGAAAE